MAPLTSRWVKLMFGKWMVSECFQRKLQCLKLGKCNKRGAPLGAPLLAAMKCPVGWGFCNILLRYVGLMCSLFVIGHLYLRGIWWGLLWRMFTKKICVMMRLDYVLKYRHHSKFKWRQLGGPRWLLQEKKILYFDILLVLDFNSNSETWIDNLCGS